MDDQRSNICLRCFVRFSLFVSYYFGTEKTPWEVEWTVVLEDCSTGSFVYDAMSIKNNIIQDLLLLDFRY